VKGILFDLDGTLVDSLAVTFDAFNAGFTQEGARKHSPQEIMSYFGPGEGEIFARIVGKDRAEAASMAFQRHLDENMGLVPLHQGVPAVLEWARVSGIPLSIVTGRGWETTETILRHHGLLDRFVAVICHEHVSMSKPSPEGLRLALSKMGLEAPETIYVGDSWVDMRAARSAGCQAVAALWDLMADRDALAGQSPDHWAEAPGAIPRIWDSIAAV
jgi:phosphoglycolate phosphatase-like HAD superfamily hydrolase